MIKTALIWRSARRPLTRWRTYKHACGALKCRPAQYVSINNYIAVFDHDIFYFSSVVHIQCGAAAQLGGQQLTAAVRRHALPQVDERCNPMLQTHAAWCGILQKKRRNLREKSRREAIDFRVGCRTAPYGAEAGVNAASFFYFVFLFIRPHRMRPIAADVARSVVGVCVCVCDGRTDVLCKNDWTIEIPFGV